MQITSPAFSHNQPIPAKYTCQGENINPPLIFQNIPENTQSLLLLVDDPDAPAGDWIHWLVWNIEPTITSIEENSVPANSIQGPNSSGQNQYEGPCPPVGTHRYFFKLYALDIEPDLPASTDKNNLLTAIEGHIIDHVELVGIYQKT